MICNINESEKIKKEEKYKIMLPNNDDPNHPDIVFWCTGFAIQIWTSSENISCYFCTKTDLVGSHWNCLRKAIPMISHKTCFCVKTKMDHVYLLKLPLQWVLVGTASPVCTGWNCLSSVYLLELPLQCVLVGTASPVCTCWNCLSNLYLLELPLQWVPTR